MQHHNMARDKGELRRRVRPRERTSGENDAEDPNWPYAKGHMDRSAKFIGVAVLVITVSLIVYFKHQADIRERIRMPLDTSKIIASNSSTAEVNPVRFWGTYRSHMYFGMKTRSPTSPVLGLMWMRELTGQMPPPIRHWCDQGDNLKRYGWLVHDGVSFGMQELNDDGYTVYTDFVKRPGGGHGGDWSARIRVQPEGQGSQPIMVSLFFYVALDGQGSLLQSLNKNRLSSITGQSLELGNFEVKFTKTAGGTPKYHHLISYAPSLEKLKDVMIASMKIDAWDKARKVPYFVLGGRVVPKDSPGGPNFIVYQVTAMLPMEMEVIFESGSIDHRPDTLSGDVLTAALSTHLNNFNAKFEQTFQLAQKGYKDEEVKFAKAALSNMVGGIGYFYGSSLVQSEHNKEPIEYWKAPLFTAVPSRPFFPRGFLWDEGFHNLLISRWDEEISKDIIGHWLDTMNVEGWIPREQILGAEAQAKVPAEFVVQRNKNANPPTFFLPLQKLVKTMIGSSSPRNRDYLNALYPRLKAWFAWYNTSQAGSKPSTYRWHGRDPDNTKQLNPLTLTSGLDDYPRASHPTADERHVDLRCWLALASGVMAEIGQSLDKDWEEYAATHRMLTDNVLLDELHWSERGQQYSDYGLHTDKVKLERPKPPPNLQPGQRPPPMSQDKVRVVMEEPKYQYLDTFGYVSLFPFLLKIVQPDSPKLYTILTDLKKPNLLWTDYGLRSLSRSAKLYGRFNTEHDPPYWRGAIWINMNYLVLEALNFYAKSSGPYQELAQTTYTELRNNVVSNMVKEYSRTGFLWENYSDKTGEGKGCRPFTGWSALVVLMMAEKY